MNKLVNEIPSSKYCIIKHDVSNFKEAANYFADAVKIMEGLDEIYYCAGILEKVSIDEFSTEKDIRMLNINTLGAFAWLNPAADFFQKKNSGKIVGIYFFPLTSRKLIKLLYDKEKFSIFRN